MYQSRVSSVALSVCLHAAMVLAALFWPASSQPPVDLAAPVIDVNLYTIGRPGKAAPAAPRAPAGPAASPVAPEAPPAAKPTPPPPPKEVAPPAPPKPVVPEAKPIPIPQPEKPVVPPKPEPAKPEPVKPTPAKPEPAKPQARSEDALKNALKELGGSRNTQSRGGQSGGNSLDAALRDLKTSGSNTGPDAEGDGPGGAGGDGPGGAGGDGIGIVGSYMQSLVSRIKQNYEYVGRADRKNPMAIVEIHIAKDGSIIDSRIVESSGDDVFNGFVLSAIRNTQKVEPPPTPDLTRVRLSFAYQEMR